MFYSVQFTYPADAQSSGGDVQPPTLTRSRRSIGGFEPPRDTNRRTAASLRTSIRNPFCRPAKLQIRRQRRSLARPFAVWDNGYSTLMKFPGNARIPSIFVINPDGKEATASYSVHGEIVEVDQTARECRLRYGHTVLNIYNLGYHSLGSNPGTGTVSPDCRGRCPPVTSPGAKP